MAKKKDTKGKNILMKALAPKKRKGTAKKGYKRIVGRWGGHKFIVSNKKIESFTNLTIKGSCEVERKKKEKQKYVTKKTGQSVEINLDIILNAYFGSDVRKEALKWVKEARKGKQSYFYLGKKKLIASKLLLKSANVKNIELSPGGKWVTATVSISLEQSTKKNSGSGGNSDSGGSGGSGGGGGGGGGGGSINNGGGEKQSVRNTSPITTGRSTLSDQQAKNTQNTKTGQWSHWEQREFGVKNETTTKKTSTWSNWEKKEFNTATQAKKQDEETVRRARQKGLP